MSALKDQIEVKSKIPSDKQVLLISGGECLDPNKRVCSYSAGTDTNPIFLFSKSLIESTSPPAPTVDYVFDSGKYLLNYSYIFFVIINVIIVNFWTILCINENKFIQFCFREAQ